jgi:hypothetical protein
LPRSSPPHSSGVSEDRIEVADPPFADAMVVDTERGLEGRAERRMTDVVQ